MRVAVTGATGYVGRFLVDAALAAGDDVTILARRPPAAGIFPAPVGYRSFALGEAPDLFGQDALVHAALSHVPGRYRGGEGNDPAAFARANLDGSRRLFEAARADGIARAVFLSSRAVYGAYPAGTDLAETMAPRPDTLYGEVKHRAEAALHALAGRDFAAASLRVTGVYGSTGPDTRHKWSSLFDDYLSGHPVAPRAGTEVHGADLAAAVRCVLLAAPERMAGRAFNVSDILLDRHELLRLVAGASGCLHPLPAPSCARVSVMQTDRLAALGWRPGGWQRLRQTVPDLL